MADRSASGLQKPSSRLVKPIGKPLGGSGTAATALSANPLATAAALGANRGAERRDSVSSISSTSVNSTAKKADTATNPSEIQLSVGDVVSIPGGKQGKLLFLGETHFAKGEWAGVYLDEAAGKNDGSLDGKSYFTCPDKYGIFIKPNKLTRVDQQTPKIIPAQVKVPLTVNQSRSAIKLNSSGDAVNSSIRSNEVSVPSKKMSAPSGPLNMAPLSDIASTPRKISTSNAPMRSMTPANNQSNFGAVQMRVKPGAQADVLSAEDLTVGEKVWVNGLKQGAVAFVGETEFATGVWVGIILGDKSGKNDGSVSGKRYFTCEHGFGLFSPISKISKEPKRAPSAFPQAMQQKQLLSFATPQRPASAVVDPRLRQQQQQQQQETAVLAKRRGSATGQLLLQKDKLGGSSGSVSSIGSAASAKFNGMLSNSGGGSGGGTLQQLQMLLREAEVRESQLTLLVDQSDKAKLDLDRQLEEERRKVEDLHFRMEEEAILRGDLMNEKNMLKHQQEMMEQELREVREQLEELRKNYSDLEFQLAEQSMSEECDSGVSVNSNSNSLTTNLAVHVTELEETVRAKEDSLCELRAQLDQQKSQNHHTLQQAQLQLSKENSLAKEICELKRELGELNNCLNCKQNEANEIEFKLNEMKISHSSLEEQLKAQIQLASDLKREKQGLEATVESLVNNSGDSDSQVAILTKEVKSHQAAAEQMRTQMEELREERVRLTAQIDTTKMEWADKLRDANDDHSKELAEKKQKISQLESKIAEANENMTRYQVEVNKSSKCMDELREKCQNEKSARELAEQEREKWKLEKQSAENELKTMSELLSQAKSEIESSNNKSSETIDQQSELNELRKKLFESIPYKDQVSRLESEIEGLKKELADCRVALNSREQQIANMKLSAEEWSASDSELSLIREQYDTVLSKYMSLQSAIESKDNELVEKKQTVRRLETDNEEQSSRIALLIEDYAALEKKLEEAREQLKVVDNLKEQVSRLKRNVVELNEKVASKELSILQYKESNSKFKAELDVALKKAEGAQSVYSTGGDFNTQIKSERDSLQKQVDFLNSVIVELSNKNEHLAAKLEAFAFGGHLDGTGVASSGPSVLDEDSPVKGYNHNIRPFCDICDEFDLHDTEDCPMQDSRPLSPPATRNNGNITDPRPYCDICDCFDHWTHECDDDQMF